MRLLFRLINRQNEFPYKIRDRMGKTRFEIWSINVIRLLIYLFPLAIDMCLSTLFFVCTLRMAESRASAFAVSLVCTVWALTYSLSAFTAGRVVNERNAAGYAIWSCLGLAVLSLLFIMIPDLRMQYALMVLSGVFTAFFFTPFQVFMKVVMGQSTWSLGASIGFYTAAWSTGMALGPFVSGFLWQHFDWRVCHLVNCVIVLACAAGLVRLRHYAAGNDHAGKMTATHSEPIAPAVDYGYERQYRFVAVGWIFGGVSFLAVALVRAVFPTLATALTVGKADQGMVFALLFIVQAATGLALCAPKRWMYNRTVLALMTAPGILGMIFFGLGHDTGTFLIGAVLFGVYSGMASCYIVFHSLVDPHRSTRNVSINEGIVGITNIFGPVGGGILADHTTLSMPFLLSAVLIVLALVGLWRIHSRHPEVA